jgi:GDPmannose 4,6-dehydratase
VVDPKFYRPAEVHLLVGDCSKAKKQLGWEPKVSFEGLVHMMVDADLKHYQDLIARGQLHPATPEQDEACGET